MSFDVDLQIRMIPVDQINILNPRGAARRNLQKSWQALRSLV